MSLPNKIAAPLEAPVSLDTTKLRLPNLSKVV
jgi:hypothetical protein